VLRRSAEEDTAKVGQQLDTYYRNANIRFAVAGKLLNRMLPKISTTEEEVDDEFLGTRVFGRSETSTRISLRLLPDRLRLRMGLEARGRVNSRTAGTQGPVTFFNWGESDYLARKLLLVDRTGLRTTRAEAGAEARTDLTGVETDFDSVPLVRMLTRAIARSQHDARHYEAVLEVEERVSRRARARMDREVRKRLSQVEARFRENVLEPLQTLQLDPVAKDMQTTQQRMIVRCRLAGGTQLAAHTPRPRAPADSMLSVQIHQSAANNVIEQLKLDGQRTDLRSLYREVADALGRDDIAVPDDVPEGVTVQFADSEPVRVQFVDGRAMLTVKLAELAHGRRRWRNFTVRGYYRPESNGLDADLVRDGTIELAGKRLNLRDQVALRGIFSKVLSKKRKLDVIDHRLAEDPRLKDLDVNQFLVENGWIGVALGPQRNQGQRVVTR